MLLGGRGFEPTIVFNVITVGMDQVVTTVDTRLVGLTTMGKKRLHDLLVTLAARHAVRNIAGRGTAAPMRGVFAWHLTIMLPKMWWVAGMGTIKVEAVVPPSATAAEQQQQ